MPGSAPTPDWVIALLRELNAEGKDNPRCASLITEAGYDCNATQVHRWKLKRGIRQIWRGDDQALDGIIGRLKANDELGPLEGHVWVHSVVNDAIPGGERVGRNRVCAALRRSDPAAADARKEIVKKRLVRRVYVADYNLQRAHFDLECKLTFGTVIIYIYGQVDGDARKFKSLTLIFVKTARASFRVGYLQAVRADGGVVADLDSMDAGKEWGVIKHAREQQGFDNNVTTSMKNNRIERPWLDVGMKVVRPVHEGVEAGLTRTGLLDLTAVHDRYALRATIYWAVEYGLDEFKRRFNAHNVSGPRGGVPDDRAKHRVRPPTAPAPNVFDSTTDWCASYAAATGCEWHARDHFIEVYCNELLSLLRNAAGVPSPEATWKDVKVHKGLRGELQTVFRAAKALSQGLATADSLVRTENTERESRGSRNVSED